MCGIAGIWDRKNPSGLEKRVMMMNDALEHRGPDGSGFWGDMAAGIALGHRRLAIVDLTETGHQPMISAGGRYVITYNGEIYNAEELRARLVLAGFAFRGTSDTEVLVNAIEAWGVEIAAAEINGIFAFAVWDRAKRKISLVRDRVGVKPLFWSFSAGRLQFASELKAMVATPEFDRTLDLAAIGSYLQYDYIRTPMTIYRAARSLEPGTVLTIQSDGGPQQHTYWDLADIVASKQPDRARQSDREETIEKLEVLLKEAVRGQLVSDVPIGVFLSGGVDSSIVAALMQKAAGRKVRSFAIGFDVPAFNEAEHAASVAAAIGTDHTELYVSEKDALRCIPDLTSIYDQPHADPSAIPTYLLAKMAREHVTVALTGDGGDELFFGYERYRKAAGAQRVLRGTPEFMRNSCCRALDWLFDSRKLPLDKSGRANRLGWHASRLLHFASGDVNDAYLHFITHWPEPDRVVAGASTDFAHWEASKGITSNFGDRMMYFDTVSYLRDGVLAKVDRASMAASLEARVPLLDHRVIEMAWGLPMDHKFREGELKWCLRQLLYRHVPRSLVDRPKSGFGAPIGAWLRGPLREWAESLLSVNALRDSGLIDPVPIRRLWQAHLAGAVDGVGHLWSILLLQDWLQKSRASAPPVH